MTLSALGYTSHLENYRIENGLERFSVGRVIAEHKERYIIKTPEKEWEAEILGNLRFTAQSRYDFPAVGDWVAFSEYDEDKALIHAIFPRKSILERQQVGKRGEPQIIATNIDTAFIVQAIDRDFSMNRIERYLTLCHASNVNPVVLLSKIDLISDTELHQRIQSLQKRLKDIHLFPLSNESLSGIEEVRTHILKGKTYCLLGSSGVGKSTLVNSLLGTSVLKTAAISEHSNRGKHVTTHRELHVLDNGGLLIDNPGMREVGITDSEMGLASTFDTIEELSENCKFKDCTHRNEIGCAVLKALDDGELDEGAYENYQRMQREQQHYEADVAEKRRKDKMFGKMMKNYKKGRPKG